MGIANISWVTDSLATGGDLSYLPKRAAAQMTEIIDSGVQLIIDVRQEANDQGLWSDAGIGYLHLPTDDRIGHHIPSHLFDNAVDEALKFLPEGKVLVHCHMGVNRGPSVAYGVLLELGHGVVEAFDLIRSRRTQAAVLYANDALTAHGLRHDWSSTKMKRELAKLRQHISSIWTPEERARIQRVIRQGHVLDRREMELLRGVK